MKDFLKKHKYLILTIIVTLFTVLGIFLYNGLFPFGDEAFSIIDFDSAYTPVYYKLWDLLHGQTSLLFDWNLGAGLNSFGSLIMNSLLLPTSWVVALFPRDMVPQAMSIVLLLKMLEIAILTYLALHKIFPKLENYYKFIFTLLYTFSGWTIFMISNILYLDVVAIFPLFVYSFIRLLKDNKWLMFLITLTMCLLLNYYMAWMILFFIIGGTIIALITLNIPDKKVKAVKITLLIFTSLALSSILFLPSFYQSMTSYRMSDTITNPSTLGTTLLKITYILPLAIPLTLCFKQFISKGNKRMNIFFILLLVYLLIGIFVEPINAWWHTGSYSGFPFRYSYIPSFIIICIALYYLNNNYQEVTKGSFINIGGSLILIGLYLGFGIYFMESMQSITYHIQIEKLGQFACQAMLCIIAIASTFIILKNARRSQRILMFLLTMSIIGLYSYAFLQNNHDEQKSLTTQKVKETYQIPNDNYNYLDHTLSLSYNSPYILNRPSMDNRLHIIKPEEKNFSDSMGHYSLDTFIFGGGGTLLSNLFMQNKYIFTKRTLNEELYNLLETHDGLNLYETKYNLSYVIPYNGTIYNDDTGSVILNQNNIYKKLFNKEEDLIHQTPKQDNEEDFTYSFEPHNIYYMFLYPEEFTYLLNVDRSKLHIEQLYFNEEQANIYLEFYVDEAVDLTISKNIYIDAECGFINLEEYIAFFNELNTLDTTIETKNNKRTYNITSESDTSILIPVNYDTGFKVLVNGEETPYNLNVYNMISLDIKKGANKVELIFIPKFALPGLIITLVTILLLVIILFLDKKVHFLAHKFLLYPLFTIACLLGLAFILKIYILSWL